MERMAHNLASYLGKSLNKNDEEIAVMAYGLTAIIQVMAIFVLALILGLLLNVLPEALIVFFSVGFLRRLIGGHHADNIYSCLIISVFCITLFALISHYLPINDYIAIIFTVIIYIYAFIATYRLAPVDSPNKPIRTEKKRKRLRKNSFIVLTLFFLLSISFILLHIRMGGIFVKLVISLDISVFWQVSMLTTIGGKFIDRIDCFLNVCSRSKKKKG